MAGRKDRSGVIDGFSTVAAVRHARERTGAGDAARQPEPEPRKAEPSGGREARGRRIGHTVLPDRHEIACYACGYAFVLNGRIRDTFCPKCRELLTAGEHVAAGEWNRNVKTIGRFEVKPEGVLRDCEIVAQQCVLGGDAREAHLRVGGVLELRPGARFNAAHVQARDIVVRAGARFSSSRKLVCRNIDIEGRIKTRLFAEGVVTIHAGGCLLGEVHGGHLVVKDGGGLKADVYIGNER